MKRSHPPSLTEGTNNNIQNKTNKSSISEYNFKKLDLSTYTIIIQMKSLLKMPSRF